MPRSRKQMVELGGYQAAKIGIPTPIGDLYYKTMEMSWPSFVGSVALVFLVLNLVFGAAYAALPGAISGLTPGSLAQGFFFSAETLGTVGYGNLAPQSMAGHGIVALEILVGLFFSATITGLIFARFARPGDCLVFSRIAVIGRVDGKRALMVRLISTRPRPLADATAQIAWLERLHLPDGRLMRRLIDLPLVRSHSAMMGLSWTLIHMLEDDSDFMNALRGSEQFNLTVSVAGMDTLLATQSLGGCTYRREQILLDHEFVDVIHDVDGVVQLDFLHFHDARHI